MKRGFSASTFLLVALLLSVLFWVGKVVNPPVKGGHQHSDEAETNQPEAAKPPASPKPAAQGDTQSKMTEPKRDTKVMAERVKEQERKLSVDIATHTASPVKTAAVAGKKKAHATPDGMEPELWQERDMGPVTPAPDTKK